MAGVMPTSRVSGAGHVAQPVAEDLRVGGRAAALFGDAGCRVETRHAVVLAGIGFGRRITLALSGDDMQKLRAVRAAACCRSVSHQRVQIVAVDRADVVEAELLEHRAGRTMPLTCSSARLASSRIGGATTAPSRRRGAAA